MQQRLLYPFLLGLYFVLFVLSENLGEVYLDEIIRSVVTLWLVTGLVILVLARIFRSFQKAGFLTALLLAIIFMHSGLEGFFPHVFVRNIFNVILLMGLELTAFLTIAFLTLRGVNNWPKLNQTLNATVGILLLVTLYPIGVFGVSDTGTLIEPEPEPERQAVSTQGFVRPDGIPPNIYYILVDAYTRADTLKDYFDYDNSEFIAYLEDTGFQVAHRSVANYNHTKLVIPSVLNFDYIADGEGFREEHPHGYSQLLSDRATHNRVASILQAMGYRIVTVQSAKEAYLRIDDAEELMLTSQWLSVNGFERALLDMTLLPRMLKRFLYGKRESVDFVLDEVTRQASTAGPMFLAAHVMVPHQPFIYARNGGTPKVADWLFGEPENFNEDVQAYADQVHYLNVRLREVIDTILAKSETPPIIILQGDHGLRLTWWKNRNDPDVHKQLEGLCVREVFTNLNAVYLPGPEGQQAFYDSISPVNTFRLIFDSYFGSELGLLEDRSFLSTETADGSSMSFLELTGSQNTCSSEWEARFKEVDRASALSQ